MIINVKIGTAVQQPLIKLIPKGRLLTFPETIQIHIRNLENELNNFDTYQTDIPWMPDEAYSYLLNLDLKILQQCKDEWNQKFASQRDNIWPTVKQNMDEYEERFFDVDDKERKIYFTFFGCLVFFIPFLTYTALCLFIITAFLLPEFNKFFNTKQGWIYYEMCSEQTSYLKEWDYIIDDKENGVTAEQRSHSNAVSRAGRGGGMG